MNERLNKVLGVFKADLANFNESNLEKLKSDLAKFYLEKSYDEEANDPIQRTIAEEVRRLKV